jgi:thioredoxin-related protein
MGKLLMVLCFLSLNASGQTRPVSFEDLSRLQAKEARPVFVLITTGWCKYCHAMKTMLLRHKTVSQLMEDKFYLVFMPKKRKIFFLQGNYSGIRPVFMSWLLNWASSMDRYHSLHSAF